MPITRYIELSLGFPFWNQSKKRGGGGTIDISEELHLALAMTKTYREKVIDVHYA